MATLGRLAARILPLATLSAACGNHPTANPAPPPAPLAIHVDRARTVSFAAGEDVVGTVRARRSAAIAATVMGRVAELPVSLGQHVAPGELLVRIAAGEIGAQVERARAVQARAEVDFERARRLFDHEAIPRAQYDAAQSELQVARSSLAEASAMADHTVLRAPFAGVVTSKIANAGDTAMPGQVLLVVEDPRSMRFESTVPEALTHALASGQALPVRIDGLGDEMQGTVAEISPAADPTSRTVLAKIDLPADPRLHPGLFGRLTLASGRSPAVAVPAAVVVHHGQLEELFVISGDTARLRLVKTGQERDGSVEILSGLNEGEIVAVSDLGQLTDDRLVSVLP